MQDIYKNDPEIASKLSPSTSEPAKGGEAKQEQAQNTIPYRAFLRSQPVQALCFTHFANNWCDAEGRGAGKAGCAQCRPCTTLPCCICTHHPTQPPPATVACAPQDALHHACVATQLLYRSSAP